MRTRSLAVCVTAAAALSLAGCGSGGPAHGTTAGGPAKAATLTVWLMDGDLSAQATAAINAAFEKATGAKADVQIQQWANINTKISTALAQNDPPDVIEIGNTDVPLFAATGALSDITADQASLSAGQSWLPGLLGPATVEGKVYAAPLFAGNRAVIYNKALWARAGITTAPTSFTQLTADLDAIRAKNPQPGFSAFNFPGQYWYGALQFVWDAGGQLATESNGRWTGALDSPAAQQGLRAWKSFQNSYSAPASRNVDTKSPDQAAMFASGKTATILDTSINTVLKDNPALKGQIGTFPFPSATTPGRNQPVFLGGSDLAIAAKSANQALALAYLKAATSTAVQTSAIVGIDGWTPVSTQLIDSTQAGLPPTSAAFFQAAKSSVATPATPGWATIESDASINTFFADIATGRTSVAQAAASFDAHLDQALNASQ
ncbi:extracellular solute-binding protein [Streptacidiphilus sp. P02-A3a]|uniref:extracellular solute-binding protein n=1 Tax=Streptacidiphilus sp. P02-A3a TaxID=2704468 RepID=UPI0015F922C8|nr:extracellular solute-binding protein [Streptacidiphilus sp. P02-A3a]QMU70469.1 extracellular solute-binding protein [Streptacidiphilus sp. P02-A3a]